MPERPRLHYAPVARALHWVMAALVLFTIPAGFLLLTVPPGPIQNTLFDLHRSVGVLLFVLVVVRIGYRLAHPPPPLPADVSRLQRVAARTVHAILYGILLVNPLVGWWGTSAFGAPISVFWLFQLPPLVPRDMAVAERILGLHGVLGLAMAIAVALHVAAALHHHFVRRDDVLRRML